MTQYDIINVKFPTSQINKLNCDTKNGTEVTLKLSPNVISDSND